MKNIDKWHKKYLLKTNSNKSVPLTTSKHFFVPESIVESKVMHPKSNYEERLDPWLISIIYLCTI